MKVSVRDTGIGLSRESMDKLFTSFQRFDLQRNQSMEGTGLGLSICKQLSELMGGTVYAESEYGKGSMFCCEIPQKIGSEVPVGKVELIREKTGVDSAADEVAEGKTTVRELSEGSSLIDRKLGLKYTGEDEGVYEEILDSYVKVGHKKLPLIRELCRRETWKDYVTEVHALKSTSLSIGAEGLSEAAAELEKAGKAGEYELIREKNEDLLMLYGEVLAACEGMLYRPADKREVMETIPPVSDRKVLSEELLTNYALRMEKAVRSFDNDEIVVICNELAGYSYRGVDLGERFAAVREAAEDFECEKAGETAKQIFEELR